MICLSLRALHSQCHIRPQREMDNEIIHLFFVLYPIELNNVKINVNSSNQSTTTIGIKAPAVITSFGYPFHYDSYKVTWWDISVDEGGFIRLLFSFIDLNIYQVSLQLMIFLINPKDTPVDLDQQYHFVQLKLYIDRRYLCRYRFLYFYNEYVNNAHGQIPISTSPSR